MILVETIYLCSGEHTHTTLFLGSRHLDLQVTRKEEHEDLFSSAPEPQDEHRHTGNSLLYFLLCGSVLSSS